MPEPKWWETKISPTENKRESAELNRWDFLTNAEYDAYKKGLDFGYDEGYTKGYDDGYVESANEATD